MNQDDIFAACGGRPVTRGGERGWWFGFNPSEPAQTDAATVSFKDEPLARTDPRVLLTDYAKTVYGKHPPYNWQRTGSCVNGGAWNALLTRNAVDACVGNDPQPFAFPFTLPAYGLSRFIAFGRDDQGEGSTGDAMAQALRDLGSTQYDLRELAGVIPKPTLYDCAFTYTDQEELLYSRKSGCPAAVTPFLGGHKIEFVKVTTIEQAEAEIRKLRPITIAGNWGSRMTMSYKGTGANRVLFGSLEDRWEHQMSVQGVWHHPEFGRLWNIMQQWYFLSGGVCKPVHGMPANDEAPGTFWVDDSMILHQLNYRWGELRSIKSLKGYDQGKLTHVAI